jgi:uncharacterized protein (DUF2062 family)
MGIIPIWGFQLAVAITLSFLLRLNKAIVIIAANISIPPMIPVILFVSHLTGGFWMGKRAQSIPFSTDITFEMFQASLTQYVLGAITLAVIAGVMSGIFAYGFIKLTGRKNETAGTVRDEVNKQRR